MNLLEFHMQIINQVKKMFSIISSRVIRHPNYSSYDHDNDIALIKNGFTIRILVKMQLIDYSSIVVSTYTAYHTVNARYKPLMFKTNDETYKTF